MLGYFSRVGAGRGGNPRNVMMKVFHHRSFLLKPRTYWKWNKDSVNVLTIRKIKEGVQVPGRKMDELITALTRRGRERRMPLHHPAPDRGPRQPPSHSRAGETATPTARCLSTSLRARFLVNTRSRSRSSIYPSNYPRSPALSPSLKRETEWMS